MNFTVLIILISIMMLYLLYIFFTKRITRLNQIIKCEIKNNLLMLNDVKISRDQIIKLENQLQENSNIQLQQVQQETLEKNTGKKELLTNNEYITQFAHYDNLTQLPNRIFFNEILNKSISHAKRHNKFLAILYINLNAFKNINTTSGHAIGDQVLKEVGSRLLSSLRSEDVLARLEADEFIVLLSDINKPKFASAVSEKIFQALSKPININQNELTLTASIGICIYPNDGHSLEQLLKNADAALYEAKHLGGNAYQFYTKEIDIEAREYIQLESALRKAIQSNALILHYQPKFHIKRGNIAGVEALIRWEHPEFGLISPAKFIPLAEETGLIMQIGEWALREACKTNKYWQEEGYEHLNVGINLSPQQFYHPDIATLITKILKETGLNPTYLELEITEKTVMDNVEIASGILEKIKSTGVTIAIDHFGTGYTSISHLKKFPVSILKIDQSFIKGIPHIPNDLAITSAFIALAHNLGLEVVAEGIETADQIEYLAAQNCDIMQGYFLSYPLPADKIALQFKKLMDEVLFK